MSRVEPMRDGASSSYNAMTGVSDSASGCEISNDEEEATSGSKGSTTRGSASMTSDSESSTTSDSESSESSTLHRGPSSRRQEGVVVLVVSDDQEAKRSVADCLTGNGRDSGWTLQETAAGVRIFTHSSGLQVVEPSRLQYVQNKSGTAIGRRWISHNSLRRIMLGHFVLVFCVISGSIVEQPLCLSGLKYDSCWMDIVGMLFKNQLTGVMFIVNKHDSDVSTKHKDEIKYFVRNHGFRKENILYANCSTHNGESVMSLMHDAIRPGNLSPTHSRPLDSFISMLKHDGTASIEFKPFLLDSRPGRYYSPWDPERVLLFGKTGSGKSTLAQMLTQGELTSSNKFNISPRVRGGTREIHAEMGRGWYVVDTPGFGEPEDEKSTITTKEAQLSLLKYVHLVEGSFSHYIFVQRKERIDELDMRLWEFFTAVFSVGSTDRKTMHPLSVLISGADQDWMDDNKEHLSECFKGCGSFLCAEFPAMDVEDQEMENELNDIRQQSLQSLEEELAKSARFDLECGFGRHSKMHRKLVRDFARTDLGLEKDNRIKLIVRGVSHIFHLSDLMSGLVSHLTVNKKVALVPNCN